MAKHTVTFIPGDGIGPEVSDAAKRCILATGVDISFEEVHAGAETLEKTGTVLPQSVIDSIKKNKVAIKGPITTPVGSGFRSVNVALRTAHDLYACVRPCKTYEGVQTKYDNIDLVIVRENTEDLYAGIEFEVFKPETKDLIQKIESLSGSKIRTDSGISIKPISITGTKRIVKFAFDYAIANGRKKVTAVHKANIMKFSDGLFLKVAREVAAEYQGKIEFEDKIVDNMCMQLVQSPQNFDVIVLPNLYGDILSDLCAGLIGGLGVAGGANIGDDIALFEATHGSAPEFKGKNKLNPCAMIFSAVLMLSYLKEDKAAQLLEKATSEVIRLGEAVTCDFKADSDNPSIVGTKEMADAIIEKINQLRND